MVCSQLGTDMEGGRLHAPCQYSNRACEQWDATTSAVRLPSGKRQKTEEGGRPDRLAVWDAEEVVLAPEPPTAVPRPASINDLPLELRIKIFSHLEPQYQRRVLPLVCQAWEYELASDVMLYNHMDIDIHAELALSRPGAKVDAGKVADWLARRARSVWSLRFRNLHKAGSKPAALFPAPPPATHTFCGASLAALLRPLVNLQELVIEECHSMLTSATFEAISNMQHLKVLSLKGIRKRLEDPDFKAITKLHKLEELVLDCDQAPAGEPGVEEMKWGLQGFPEGMEHLVNITHLTLSSHPSITHLPLSIGKLTKLQVLNVDFCQLDYLPACLGDLTNLTTLDLEGNPELGAFKEDVELPLEVESPGFEPWLPRGALHSQLASLQEMRYLNLNACGLRALPSALASFQQLQVLDMEDNNLGDEYVANWDVARHWSSLHCLNIAGCRMSHIPETIPMLSTLRILDLTNNKLRNESLPDSLTGLAMLKAIGLKSNCLQEVPPILGRLTSLEEIYLEDNIHLELRRPVDFLTELSHLKILMFGKPTTYAPASVHFLGELMRKLTRKYPTRDILRISYPGNPAEGGDVTEE